MYRHFQGTNVSIIRVNQQALCGKDSVNTLLSPLCYFLLVQPQPCPGSPWSSSCMGCSSAHMLETADSSETSLHVYQTAVHGIAEDITLNPLNAELIPICHLLALLGPHPFLHVSRIRVNRHIGITMRTSSPQENYRVTGVILEYCRWH